MLLLLTIAMLKEKSKKNFAAIAVVRQGVRYLVRCNVRLAMHYQSAGCRKP